ncbi:hypothetical protein IWX49DRAFT_210707 [Phyllosticta citricarpa]|uniref:Uncharacterized protein n=2 Tax=Phyllosticta TaxID=121621 RepID=A0ABR1MLU3_9PEZI
MDILPRVSNASLDTMSRPTLPTTSHPSTRNGRPSNAPNLVLDSPSTASDALACPFTSSPLSTRIVTSTCRPKRQLLTISIQARRLKLNIEPARVAAFNLLFWDRQPSLSSPLLKVAPMRPTQRPSPDISLDRQPFDISIQSRRLNLYFALQPDHRPSHYAPPSPPRPPCLPLPQLRLALLRRGSSSADPGPPYAVRLKR